MNQYLVPSDLAGAAAARGAAEADVAAAALLAAAGQAIATGLQHFAALRVAADAGDANAVLRSFTNAVTAAKV